MNRAGFWEGADITSSKICLLSMKLISESLNKFMFILLPNLQSEFKIGMALSRDRNKPIKVSSKTCFYFENFLRRSVFEKNTKLSLKFS